jgi:serine protease inhibitor
MPNRFTIATVVLLALMTNGVGCGRYPKVTSRESLDFIKQVYTACNTQNKTRLSECEIQLEKLVESGKIGADESTAFRNVIQLAKDGRWEESQNRALKFARDQVR